MERHVFSAIVCAVLLGAPASAADCPGFGLSTEYLSQVFCDQLRDVAEPKTRTLRGDALDDAADVPPEWMTLPLVQDAWRSDPAKTLELIKRIRDAGGRPQR